MTGCAYDAYVPACKDLECALMYDQVKGSMAYEVFKRTGARVETPTLSITPDGRIAINAAAVRIAKEARIGSVLLLWDAASHRLALKAAQRSDKNAFALSISQSHSGSLRATRFIAHIGWKGRKRETIPLAWNEKERMFEGTLPLEHLESERWGVKHKDGDLRGGE